MKRSSIANDAEYLTASIVDALGLNNSACPKSIPLLAPLTWPTAQNKNSFWYGRSSVITSGEGSNCLSA